MSLSKLMCKRGILGVCGTYVQVNTNLDCEFKTSATWWPPLSVPVRESKANVQVVHQQHVQEPCVLTAVKLTVVTVHAINMPCCYDHALCVPLLVTSTGSYHPHHFDYQTPCCFISVVSFPLSKALAQPSSSSAFPSSLLSLLSLCCCSVAPCVAL